MRRSKIRATVCVGRRKPDNSRKAKENDKANEDSNIPQAPSVDLQIPVDSISPLDTALPIIASDPKPPETNTDIPQTTHENSSPSSNRTIISRSKIRAVPKFRNRTLTENKEPKTDSKTTTAEAHTSNNSVIQELAANDSPSVKSISQVNSPPPPPTSPSKICRSKVKAIPVLGNRKPLSSASDSEDGSKRNHTSRTRTESQTSSISGIIETTVEQITPRKHEIGSDVKRKFKKSEGSRKLAEARREFSKKYVDGKPDYKRLTMMDLIFYNPTTNLMRHEKKKSDVTEENPNPDEQTEEDVANPTEVTDDSSKQNDEQMNKSDDEDDIIAPRIKIGPTGEIILDEKSLVIENTKVKKAQEAIEKSVAIDGDMDRPYGVYKRSKRSKDWTQSETVKFYRALSTVGTDFSLMNELFPKRTRRELKIKFKKEEKINQALIDEAIMKPCNFNYEELKTEFEMMDVETLEREQQHIKEQELNKKKQNKKSAKLLKITFDNNSMDNTHDNSDDAPNPGKLKSVSVKPMQKRIRKPRPPKPSKKIDIFSALSESDNSDLESVDSEESFVWKPTHTTRYGRKTKRREIFEPSIDVDEELIIQKKIRKPNPEPEPSQKPGSIMMVSSETPDGQSVVKIFMVTDDSTGNKNETTPQNLLPIAMIRTDHTDDETEEEIVENNYTIPADTDENLRKPIIEKSHVDLAVGRVEEGITNINELSTDLSIT